MIIVDPTVTNTEQNNTRAPAVAMLKGKTIGVLSNRKLNADLLLRQELVAEAEWNDELPEENQHLEVEGGGGGGGAPRMLSRRNFPRTTGEVRVA